jgi:hypothetical protein
VIAVCYHDMFSSFSPSLKVEAENSQCKACRSA